VVPRHTDGSDPASDLGLASETMERREASSVGLLRGISRPLLVAVLVNAIIGAGILGLPGRAYAIAGTWSLLAWLGDPGVRAACDGLTPLRLVS
jgi:hypothetical protein